MILRAGAAIPAGILLAGAAGGPGAAAPGTVDMGALLKAAQWDPYKTGTGITPGARSSVLLVEQALAETGLLDPSLVDGHFGTATLQAYTRWQQQLGYRGLAANGLPGPSSLERLGQNRFRITGQVRIGARQSHQGHPLNQRTRQMLDAAQGLARIRFTLTQGSYSVGVDPTSAGTHDGGGAVDIDAVRWSPGQRQAAVRALREVGFAAWLRDPTQDDWPWHVHGIAISDTDLAPVAQRQVGAYFLGRNGLRNNGPDDGPAVVRRTYEEYRKG